MRADDTQNNTLGKIVGGPRSTEGEQLRLAYQNMTPALAASVFCAFVMVVLLWPVIDSRGLILWLGSISTLTLLRLMLQQNFERANLAEVGEVAFLRWKRAFVGSTFISGCMWGCLGAFLFPVDSLLHQVYMAFVLGGIAAGAVSAYAPLPGAFPNFIIPALTPYALQMIVIDNTQSKIMTLMVAVFMLSMIRSARESRRNVVDLLRLQVKNAELTRQLHHKATHDSLVGLINQGEFKRRLERMTTENRRDKSDYSLIFIDLDMFKEVNDAGGHAAGDLVLRGVAEIIRRNTRGGDTAARVGGDEFAAILEDCPQQRATEIAETIRCEIEHLRIGYEGRYYSVQASIGVSYGKVGEHTATSMLKAADAACYAAKESGRNVVCKNKAGESYPTTDRFELTQTFKLTQALNTHGTA